MNSSADRDGPASEQILVIRFSSLGDVLLTAPTLRVLRNRFPKAHIDLLVAAEYADAASLIPGPDRLLLLDRARGFSELRRLRRELSRCYDVIVDLQNSYRSAFLRTFLFPTLWVKASRYRLRRWLLIKFKWNLYGKALPVPLRYLRAVEMLGAQNDSQRLELQIPDPAAAWADEWHRNHNPDRRTLFLLCPGARHFTKRWPLERWIEVGRRLSDSEQRVVFIGDSGEASMIRQCVEAVPRSLSIVGESIPRIAALLQKSAACVANDSGLMHLAAGVGTPLIAIFGPTVKEFGFAPYTDRARVLENFPSCRPCTAFGGAACPKKHFRCMLDTTPEMVEATLREILDSTTAR